MRNHFSEESELFSAGQIYQKLLSDNFSDLLCFNFLIKITYSHQISQDSNQIY